MNKIIQYGIERDTGLVYSQVGSECAGPVLDFAAIGQGGDGYEPGDFNGPTRYTLEKMPLRDVYPYCRWTKKIPVKIKNRHREFWGFKPLKDTDQEAS
jgi:hypothetical protein